jgi:hypothetical protein
MDATALTILATVGDSSEAVKLCPPCLMAAIPVDRRHLMKAIRTLTREGKTACAYDRCSACRKLDLVLMRPHPCVWS